MTDEEKFIQSLYEDSNERLKELYKVEKESRDELLQNIALIMLTYTVSNDLMSLTRKDKTKEYSKLSNIVLKAAKSNSKVQEGVLTEVLTDVVTKTFDFYNYNANLKEVKEIIERNFKGNHFSERVWDNEEQVAKHLHKKVNDFLNGKINVNQIKKDIEKNFNASAYNTKRLVETEVNRCSSNAFDRFCKEVGVKKVRYNATLDSKLCEDCAQFHDKVLDFNEKIEVPRHPLCRCFYTIEDDNKLFDKSQKLKYNDDKELENLVNQNELDLNRWDDKKVSGEYQYNSSGNRLAKTKDIKQVRHFLNKHDIGFVIDTKNRILPSFAAGGFNPHTGELVLREHPTYLSLRHESFHAEQYAKLGKEKYMLQTSLEREEYVYSQIMKHKNQFDHNEIYNAQYYIYTLRNGECPPPNWEGY